MKKHYNLTILHLITKRSKEQIDSFSVALDQIVVLYKFKHNDEGFKYFISYLKGEIVKPLCITLPQMSGYIKYFENGCKNMSFLIKDEELWHKYDGIWDVIKDKLDIKFHSEPVYEYKYLKSKVREFDRVIKTNFLNNVMPKENMYYSCIAFIPIDCVMIFNKKNPPQVYLEECKYRIKKTQIPKFKKTELKLDSDSDLNSDLDLDSEDESKSDAKLMAKLKKSDSEKT